MGVDNVKLTMKYPQFPMVKFSEEMHVELGAHLICFLNQVTTKFNLA